MAAQLDRVDLPQSDQLDLVERKPCVDVVYIHNKIPERLKVGAVGRKSPCQHCKGTLVQMVGEKHDRVIKCEICNGTGFTRGCVVCWRPAGEKTHQLKLVWEFDEFLDNFHRADGVGEPGDLFT